MNAEVKIDTRQFDAAMREYLQHTSKTAAFAVNKGMRDAALRAVAYVQPADRNELGLWKSLASSDPGGMISPFVAYLLRKKKEQAGTMFLAGTKYSKKAVKKMGRTGQFYTRAEAKAFGKKVFASRFRAQTFLRAFFIAAADKLTALGVGGGGGRGKAKSVPQLKTTIKTATESNPSAGFAVLYDYKRGNPHGEKASAILLRALQMGLNEKTEDMRAYINRKLAEKAREISAK